MHPSHSAYKTRTKHGCRSETHNPLTLCLQDPHEAWSPVRRTPLSLSAYKSRTKHGHQSETHTPLHSQPTRPSRSMVTGQRCYNPLTFCLQDPHEAWLQVRNATPPFTLCLQDLHEAWSPVRNAHPSLCPAAKP